MIVIMMYDYDNDFLVEKGDTEQKTGFQGVQIPPVWVSLFSRYAAPEPIGEVPLFHFLTTQQHKYREQVEEIRACTDERKRRALKAKLPAITPAGEFSKRCNTGLLRYSGFLCVDIDGKDSPDISDFEAVKKSLAGFPGLAYAGLSVGGNGLYLLIRVATPRNYAGHLNAITADLSRYGIIADKSCKDIARLRGVSFDAAPILNPTVSAYTRIQADRPEPAAHCPGQEATTDTGRRVSDLVATIKANGINITEYYGDWFAIGQSLAAEFGEAGRGWFHTVSAQSTKYKAAECDRQYTRCLQACARVTIATFFWYCKQYGISITT